MIFQGEQVYLILEAGHARSVKAVGGMEDFYRRPLSKVTEAKNGLAYFGNIGIQPQGA